MLLIMIIVLSFYHLFNSIDKKINRFVNGKYYEKYASYSKSNGLAKTNREIFLAKYMDFTKKIINKSYEYKEEDKKCYNSISDMVINEKSKKNDNVMIVMSIYVISNYCFYFFINVNIQYIVFTFLTVLIWLVLINQMLLTYRNKKGYYGTNYDEAKEIIYFIKKTSSDDINTSGGKKIFNEMEEQVSAIKGQEVTV